MAVAQPAPSKPTSPIERLAPAVLMQTQRPLFLGVSIGHPRGGVGSLGPFVSVGGTQTGIVSTSFLLTFPSVVDPEISSSN